jgi:SAM-dependent methyltransferase
MKRTATAALANRAAVAEALREVLPPRGLVLEVGSGTGEHAAFLAAGFPHLAWQPSDPDPEARASIRAWSDEAGLANLRAPLDLDLLAPAFALQRADALLCLNVLHVAPPACADALLDGAVRILPPGGLLAVLGPFTRSDAPHGPRLARIERTLRAHDPSLGVRDEDALVEGARARGLVLERALDMPEEGDRLLLFRRARPSATSHAG